MKGEKLPLLMIGKSANPRCFKNVKKLPIQYEANTKAWMTCNIFESWLRKLDMTLRKSGRRIALVKTKATVQLIQT
ncbi:Uncharacterised protein r2_g2915 [Pycnogonum litorale]